jgi:hypothetical protein
MIGTLVKYVGPPTGHVYPPFIGAYGLVIHYTRKSDGRASARVRWIQPVEYAGRFTNISDFSMDALEVISESG